jgi:hypothetical protein
MNQNAVKRQDRTANKVPAVRCSMRVRYTGWMSVVRSTGWTSTI